jgi:hypothetical protein
MSLRFIAVALVLGMAAGSTDTTPVLDTLRRTIGDVAESLFDLEVSSSACDKGKACFTLESASFGTDTPRIKVTGSSLSELSYGAGYYLRRMCNMSFSWSRTGGNQVKIPAHWPSVPNSKLVVTRTKPLTYYQNVCTESYSMWYWGWDRWVKEIDWMALHGINLVLAYTGQEQIYREVYHSMGVNDSVILGTFDGPAFLAWSRGQGTAGNAGPLPESWLHSQVTLNQNITSRMRTLGIEPILSAFQGNVPAEFAQLFPGHNITKSGGGVGGRGAWLPSKDPLFTTIATGVKTGMEKAFGTNKYFEADGWFGTQTGPWLSSSPPPIDGQASEQEQSQNYGCVGGFTIPSEEEGRARAAAVFKSFVGEVDDGTKVGAMYSFSRCYSSFSYDGRSGCIKGTRGAV